MVLLALLALPFSRHFPLVFILPFQQELSSKSSEPKPKTDKIHEILQKILIETHPQPRAAKRLRLRGVTPFKLTTLTTLSAVSHKAQGPESEAKKAAEIEASGTQNN